MTETDGETTRTIRPKRNVPAHVASGECEHCGGNACSLLGDEHIWKCSEIVPATAVEALAEELRENAGAVGIDPTDAEIIASTLEEMVNR